MHDSQLLTILSSMKILGFSETQSNILQVGGDDEGPVSGKH